MNCVKSIVFAAALLSAGAAFSAPFSFPQAEGSYPEQPAVGAVEGRSRAEVTAEAARYNEAGTPGLIRGEDRPELVQSFGQHGLTRAEVAADLELWQRAGLSAAGYGEASPDVYDRDYQAKLAQYQVLRHSRAYAELVRQIAARTGETIHGG